MPRPIRIGHSDGRGVRLSTERRATHLHVMGASGQGKSKFLEHCVREDIMAGHGVCLIDPEGALYDSIVAWCARHRIDRHKRIHLFDPTNPNWRFRFNPLYVHAGEKPRHRIDNVIEALAQVWGGEDSRNTPSIRTTIRAIFDVLIGHGYTLAEAFYLTSTVDPYRIVSYLTHDIENPIIAEIWDGYKATAEDAKREHISEFGGSRRRFSELLSDEEIRETLAAYDQPIDFRRAMDNGEIVLINLSPEAMGEDPARAFGALFVREMFYCAQRRDPRTAEQKPFYAYIDECGSFITRDIAQILARSRKRGFHVILAHQWLEQLREQGSSIYHGVMGIQNKVIFGGISDEDAVVMADQLFRTEYDLEIPIHALTKPGVAGYRRIWLKNWSHGESISHIEIDTVSESAFQTHASSASIGTGLSQAYDADGFPIGTRTVLSSSAAASVDAHGGGVAHAHSSGTVDTSSHSEGASEALEPILQDYVGGVHGLENVRHLAVSRLRSIPPRHAVVKGSAEPSFDITTFDVPDVVVPAETIERFKERVLAASPYTVPADQARQRMRLEYTRLYETARTHEGGYQPPPYADVDNAELG